MPEERTRLEIAFDGRPDRRGPRHGRGRRGSPQALNSDHNGAHELEAEDGIYVLPLARIVYVKRFSRETTIGFGGKPS